MVAAIAVIAEQQFVVILTGTAQRAGFTLDALPRIFLHADHHVLGELQAGGVARPAAF